MKVITIAGNIGKDPVLRRTQDGDPILGFSVAVNAGRASAAMWFDVSVFGKRAMALDPILVKGSKVTVVGDFSTREHEGRTYMQVRASEIAIQGGGEPKPAQRNEPARDMYNNNPDDLDGDIPF